MKVTTRGLTLLETLLAAALLSLLALATTSVLRDAAPQSSRPARAADLAALSRFAEEFMANPARELNGESDLAFVSNGTSTSEVTIRSVKVNTIERPHEWLVFEQDGAWIIRWRPLEEAENAPQ
jgi:type II secretory pathway component PulJ